MEKLSGGNQLIMASRNCAAEWVLLATHSRCANIKLSVLGW